MATLIFCKFEARDVPEKVDEVGEFIVVWGGAPLEGQKNDGALITDIVRAEVVRLHPAGNVVVRVTAVLHVRYMALLNLEQYLPSTKQYLRTVLPPTARTTDALFVGEQVVLRWQNGTIVETIPLKLGA